MVPANLVCKDIFFNVHALVLIFEILNKKYDQIYERIYQLTADLDRLEGVIKFFIVIIQF